MALKDLDKYYWLKLKKDFFQQHQIKVLKSMPNGRLYALIYLELLAESTTHNGELRYSKLLPYDLPTLASVIDEDVDNLKGAIEVLIKLELVEVLEDKTIYLTELKKMVGSETYKALRMREYRENKKGSNEPNCSQENRVKSIEYRDKSKDIYIMVLNYLNEKANKHYKPIDSNIKFIKARLESGYTEEQLKQVIDLKVSQWLNDKKMNKYLRPETLFNATKFETYINEKCIDNIRPDYTTNNNPPLDKKALEEIMAKRK